MDWSSLLGMLGGAMGGGQQGGSSSGGSGSSDPTKASMMGFQVPSMSGFGAKANEQNEANRLQLLKNLAPSGGVGQGSQPAPRQSGMNLSDALKNLLTQSPDKATPQNTNFMNEGYEPLSSNTSNISTYQNNGLPKKNYGLSLDEE